MSRFSSLVRREPQVAWFLGAATLALSIVGFVREEPYLWVYLPALGASIAIVVWVDLRWGPIPTRLLWLLSVWAVLHLAGGLAPDPSGQGTTLYETWLVDGVLRWDQLVHGFGIGVATVTLIGAARETRHPLAWGFGWAQVIGLVNESVENVYAAFVADSRVGDAVNTAWDLGWHLIGGSIAVIWVAVRGAPAEYRRPA